MDNKVKIPFAEYNGKIVHISEVKPGLECNCICCNCGAQLIARKGEINEHHFAHHKSEDCKKSLETSIHKAAKQYLEINKQLLIQDTIDFNKNYLVTFDKVEIEKTLYYEDKYIKVDALGYLKNNNKIIIEFALTHFASERKRQIFDKLKIPAIEISLSSNLKTFNEIDEVLQGNGFKEWLYYPLKDNPKIQTVINDYEIKLKDCKNKLRKSEDEKEGLRSRLNNIEETNIFRDSRDITEGIVGIGWGNKLDKPIHLSINKFDIEDLKVDKYKSYRLVIFNRKKIDPKTKSNLVVYANKK